MGGGIPHPWRGIQSNKHQSPSVTYPTLIYLMSWMLILTILMSMNSVMSSGVLLQSKAAEGQVDRGKVQRLFQGIKERKSPGPDGIGGWVLRNCAKQLVDIFSFIFSWSLQLHMVPWFWKDSVIIPVPNSKSPKILNDFRPMSLTSLVMKTFERTGKDNLIDTVQANLDPL